MTARVSSAVNQFFFNLQREVAVNRVASGGAPTLRNGPCIIESSAEVEADDCGDHDHEWVIEDATLGAAITEWANATPTQRNSWVGPGNDADEVAAELNELTTQYTLDESVTYIVGRDQRNEWEQELWKLAR